MFDDDLEKFSLKYPDNVPEGYGSSQMEYTFNFIYLVYKRDASIDKAIEGVALEYDLSELDLRQYLIDNKYLLNKSKKDDFSKQIKKYNTKTLKKILKKHGIKTSGKREKIEERLYKSNLLGQNYKLSSKSRIFYKNKKRRFKIFDDYLYDRYYFSEFNDFYMDNFRKRYAKIPVAFINKHIEKAITDKNHDRYISNNQKMANHFYIKKDYKSMLEYVLQRFCMNINPVWKIGELEGHVGISIETYENLRFLLEKIGKNRIISAYFVVWDSFNFERIIVPKYDGYRCLKDMLNMKDFNRINKNLDERFYSNEDLKIKRITQKTLFDF